MDLPEEYRAHARSRTATRRPAVVDEPLAKARSALWGTSVAVQESPATKTHAWLATLTSSGADTAAFNALADKAALTAAARLSAGQDVMLRWDGAKKGEAQRITAIRAIDSPADATKRPGGRGQFAMRAEFVGSR